MSSRKAHVIGIAVKTGTTIIGAIVQAGSTGFGMSAIGTARIGATVDTQVPSCGCHVKSPHPRSGAPGVARAVVLSRLTGRTGAFFFDCLSPSC